MTRAVEHELTLELPIDRALRLYNTGDFSRAREIFSELHKQSPDAPEFLVGLGMATLSCGDLASAESQLRRALQINERHDVACRCLSLVLLQKEALEEAETFAARAAHLSPSDAQNIFTLGVIKAARRDLEGAAIHYTQALRLRPQYPEALHNLGAIHLQRKEYSAAAQRFLDALALRPSYIDAYRKLFVVLRDAGATTEGVVLLKYMAKLFPDEQEIQRALAEFAVGAQTRTAPLGSEEREQQSDGVEDVTQPEASIELVEKLNRYMEVPFIVHSTQEIYDVRAALSAHLEEIAAEPGVVHNPLQTLSLSAPFLASLPMQDRLVRTSLASTLLSKIPSLRSQAQHLVSWIKDSPLGAGVSPLSADALGKRDIVAMAAPLLRRRIRVGVCSHSFSAASTASLFVDTFASLPRDVFEVSFFSCESQDDGLAQGVGVENCGRHVLPYDLTKAVEMISASRLDVLVFTEMESTPLTYFLGFSQLAPIQCATWGQPETTGLPSITYFLASEGLVPGRAQSQFSESLVTLPYGLANISPAELPSAAVRAALDLPRSGAIFICPEYPERIHPETDYVLQRILQGERGSRLVLVERGDSDLVAQLLERFRQVMPDCLEQIVVRGCSSERDLFDLIGASEVVLAPLQSSSPLPIVKAISLGKAVVTLPHRTLRSRIAYSYFKEMNFTETIATSSEHYIQIARALGRDSGWRKQVEGGTRDAYARWYEGRSIGTSEIARFFLAVVTKRHNAEMRSDVETSGQPLTGG